MNRVWHKAMQHSVVLRALLVLAVVAAATLGASGIALAGGVDGFNP